MIASPLSCRIGLAIVVCFQLHIMCDQALAEDCRSATQQVAALHDKIGRDQQTILSLGFAQRSEDLEAWAKLSENARTTFMGDALDLLLGTAQQTATAVGSLNPPTANAAISKLRTAGINSASLNSAIRKLASTAGKPARAKDIYDFLGAIGENKDSFKVVGTNWSDRQSKLEALSTVLGWAETDSRLKLLADDLKFTTSSIYNNAARRVSKAQIDKLTNTNESDLTSLKHLSEQLRTDVAAMKAAKAEVGSSCANDSQAGAPDPQFCASERIRCHHTCNSLSSLDDTNICAVECNIVEDNCMRRPTSHSDLTWLARAKALRACAKQWSGCSHSCDAYQSLYENANCMRGCNSANDSCLAAEQSIQ